MSQGGDKQRSCSARMRRKRQTARASVRVVWRFLN